VTYDGQQAWVVSGVKDLILLNSTDSEFHGFIRDEYTTLPETEDRILATAVNASWRHGGIEEDWRTSYQDCREELVRAFVRTYSRSLQQTLHAMVGRHLRQAERGRGSPVPAEQAPLPSRTRAVRAGQSGRDLLRRGSPVRLIEGTVLRDDAPPPAWPGPYPPDATAPSGGKRLPLELPRFLADLGRSCVT